MEAGQCGLIGGVAQSLADRVFKIVPVHATIPHRRMEELIVSERQKNHKIVNLTLAFKSRAFAV